MKVIITGKNSYIANKTKELLLSYGHEAECVSVRNGLDSLDLSGVDSVVHCAAIVHKGDKESISKYYKVNYELTGELARYALDKGVKHFVLLSTMAVYGDVSGGIGEDTPLKPSNVYGKSKLKAEKAVLSLASPEFKVTVLRPPMVYGEDCPGNYSKLRRFALMSMFIPDTKNKKSLLYIDNLTNFICEVLEDGLDGTFNIMDGDYISTADFIEIICKANGSKAISSKLLGKIVCLFTKISSVRKAFGSLYYEKSVAEMLDYYSIKEAVYLTENSQLPEEIENSASESVELFEEKDSTDTEAKELPGTDEGTVEQESPETEQL